MTKQQTKRKRTGERIRSRCNPESSATDTKMNVSTNGRREHGITPSVISSRACVVANNNSNGILQHRTKRQHHPTRTSKEQERKLPAACDIDQTTATANATASSDATNINGGVSVRCDKCHKSFHNRKNLNYHIKNVCKREAKYEGAFEISSATSLSNVTANTKQKPQHPTTSNDLQLLQKQQAQQHIQNHAKGNRCIGMIISPPIKAGAKFVTPYGIVRVIRDCVPSGYVPRVITVEDRAEAKKVRGANERRAKNIQRRRAIASQNMGNRRKLWEQLYWNRGFWSIQQQYVVQLCVPRLQQPIEKTSKQQNVRSHDEECSGVWGPRNRNVKRGTIHESPFENPLFPKLSFSERIVECVLIPDTRIFIYNGGDDNEIVQQRQSPKEEKDLTRTRLYLQRKLLKVIYDPNVCIHVAGCCGVRLTTIRAYKNHMQKSVCEQRANKQKQNSLSHSRNNKINSNGKNDRTSLFRQQEKLSMLEKEQQPLKVKTCHPITPARKASLRPYQRMKNSNNKITTVGVMTIDATKQQPVVTSNTKPITGTTQQQLGDMRASVKRNRKGRVNPFMQYFGEHEKNCTICCAQQYQGEEAILPYQNSKTMIINTNNNPLLPCKFCPKANHLSCFKSSLPTKKMTETNTPTPDNEEDASEFMCIECVNLFARRRPMLTQWKQRPYIIATTIFDLKEEKSKLKQKTVIDNNSMHNHNSNEGEEYGKDYNGGIMGNSYCDDMMDLNNGTCGTDDNSPTFVVPPNEVASSTPVNSTYTTVLNLDICNKSNTNNEQQQQLLLTKNNAAASVLLSTTTAVSQKMNSEKLLSSLPKATLETNDIALAVLANTQLEVKQQHEQFFSSEGDESSTMLSVSSRVTRTRAQTIKRNKNIKPYFQKQRLLFKKWKPLTGLQNWKETKYAPDKMPLSDHPPPCNTATADYRKNSVDHETRATIGNTNKTTTCNVYKNEIHWSVTEEKILRKHQPTYKPCDQGGNGGLICCEECSNSYSQYLSETTIEMEHQINSLLGHEMKEISRFVQDARMMLKQSIMLKFQNDKRRNLLKCNEVGYVPHNAEGCKDDKKQTKTNVRPKNYDDFGILDIASY